MHRCPSVSLCMGIVSVPVLISVVTQYLSYPSVFYQRNRQVKRQFCLVLCYFTARLLYGMGRFCVRSCLPHCVTSFGLSDFLLKRI